MIMFKIKLGAKVKDNVTGFKGIIVGRCEYLTGCRQYLVAAKCEKNKQADVAWYDEDRLLGNPIGVKPENNGGPQACEAPIK